MNPTQKSILELSKSVDISTISIRELARRLNVHPQTAKYHLSRLRDRGLLKLGKGLFQNIAVEKSLLGDADLVTIPFLGSANCGPATHIAGSEPIGYIKLSSRLFESSGYDSLFALKATGESMNKAYLSGKPITDGDFVIVDSSRAPRAGDCVVAVVDGLANIKRFYPETNHEGQIDRISLVSESSLDYDPIFIHPEDAQEGLIAGVAVGVIGKPAPPNSGENPKGDLGTGGRGIS